MSEVLTFNSNIIYRYGERGQIDYLSPEMFAINLKDKDVLLIDVDGTLGSPKAAEYARAVVELLGQTTFDISNGIQSDYNQMVNYHPVITEEIMNGFFQDHRALNDAIVHPKMPDLINTAIDSGWVPLVVTDRSWSMGDMAQPYTRQWLVRNGFNTPDIWICNTKDRVEFAHRLSKTSRQVVLLEDKPDAVRMFNSKVSPDNARVFLMDRPHSRCDDLYTSTEEEIMVYLLNVDP